jgi:hypothetical protein
LLSSSAKADDPVFQRKQRYGRKAAVYWIVRSSRTMTTQVMPGSKEISYAALAGGSASTE